MSPSTSKSATPPPIVSGSSFSPVAPFSWTNEIPADSVTSVNRIRGASTGASGNPAISPASFSRATSGEAACRVRR